MGAGGVEFKRLIPGEKCIAISALPIKYPEGDSGSATNVFYIESKDPFVRNLHFVLEYIAYPPGASFPKGSYQIQLTMMYYPDYPIDKPFFMKNNGIEATEASNADVANANRVNLENADAKGKVAYAYFNIQQTSSSIISFSYVEDIKMLKGDMIYGIVLADAKDTESMVMTKIPSSWKHNTAKAAEVFANAAGSNAVSSKLFRTFNKNGSRRVGSKFKRNY